MIFPILPLCNTICPVCLQLLSAIYVFKKMCPFSLFIRHALLGIYSFFTVLFLTKFNSNTDNIDNTHRQSVICLSPWLMVIYVEMQRRSPCFRQQNCSASWILLLPDNSLTRPCLAAKSFSSTLAESVLKRQSTSQNYTLSSTQWRKMQTTR